MPHQDKSIIEVEGFLFIYLLTTWIDTKSFCSLSWFVCSFKQGLIGSLNQVNPIIPFQSCTQRKHSIICPQESNPDQFLNGIPTQR